MPRTEKFTLDDTANSGNAPEAEAFDDTRREIPSAQSHGDQGEPNDWIVTAMGIGSTENGQPKYRRGDVIPAHHLTADQIRRLLDAGAMAPRSALPPVWTVAQATNTDITEL